jgi:hypothetical protein
MEEEEEEEVQEEEEEEHPVFDNRVHRPELVPRDSQVAERVVYRIPIECRTKELH